MKRALSLILVLIMVCSMMLSSCYGERGASTNEADTVHNNTENNTTEKETEKSVESQNGEKTDSATSSAISRSTRILRTGSFSRLSARSADSSFRAERSTTSVPRICFSTSSAARRLAGFRLNCRRTNKENEGETVAF